MAIQQQGTRADLILNLKDLRRGDVDLAGGKGANLGEMVAAGLPVPEGFVVTTAAYALAVEQAPLASALAVGLTTDDGAAIRAALTQAEVPAAVAAALVEAYAALGAGPVAVRSSATAEDLAWAAFAGQQDTFLDVVGPQALLDAVRRCWASLWTDRAIAYRRRQGVPIAGLGIAVVVQRMVRAEHAGVLFTANPVTGARDEIVIEAGRGIGESVVSGQVIPDQFVLDARQRVVRRRPGQDTSTPPVPGRVLTELAGLGRAVAAHFGRPQDIEWAYAAGRTWLLQARPMTALPPPPLRLSRLRRRLGLQLLDYMSVRPYPLDMSAWVGPGMGRMVERMLYEIAGVEVRIADSLPEVDGVVERFVPPSPRLSRATPAAVVRLLRQARRYDPAGWLEDPRFVRFDAEMTTLTATDPRGLGWSELFQVSRRTLQVADLVTDLRVDYLPGTAVALARLRALLTALGAARLFGVLTAATRTRTGDANRAVQDLAVRVRADTELRAAFDRFDPTDLLARLATEDRFADFGAALHTFLAEYGHRETVSPLVITAATWADDPAPLLGLVRVLVDEPARPDDLAGVAAAERQLLNHPRLRSPRRQAMVRQVLGAARQGVAFREDSHFHATRAIPVLRRALLQAGRRLAAAGVLAAPEDVFHLRLEELEAVPDPDRLDTDDADRLRARAANRAARRAELAGSPMIGVTDLRDTASNHGGLVSGTPASGGRATGPVRVVHGPADFGTLRAGEILVCPYTNPAWTPLFLRAAGVVVDSGGVGSHAAIVAREYGIPAVMGTATGTAVLTDGQRVTVDGTTGLVIAAAPS